MFINYYQVIPYTSKVKLVQIWSYALTACCDGINESSR